MKKLCSFLVLYFLPVTIQASGMPIVDVNEITKQISDSLYLISSIENLIKESTGTSVDIQAVASLKNELTQLQRDISIYQAISDGVDDLGSSNFSKSNVFVDQINSIASHIRKLKTIVILAQSLGARPEAVNTSLNMLKDQRQREREKYEIALKALEEREKVAEKRRKITARIRFKRQLQKEVGIINKSSKGTFFSTSGKNAVNLKGAQLW